MNLLEIMHDLLRQLTFLIRLYMDQPLDYDVDLADSVRQVHKIDLNNPKDSYD